MRDALILAGLIIGAIAAFFPKPEGAPPAAATVTTLPTASAIGQAPPSPTLPSAGAGIEIRRAGDGHFYAPVTVGSRAVTMLVDTGASVVALTGEDARLAGIHWDPAQLATVAQGAGGAVRGVAVSIPLMRLGQHEAREVPAVVIPEGLPVSLLGQTFLRDLEPLRIERDRMVLGG